MAVESEALIERSIIVPFYETTPPNRYSLHREPFTHGIPFSFLSSLFSHEGTTGSNTDVLNRDLQDISLSASRETISNLAVIPIIHTETGRKLLSGCHCATVFICDCSSAP